MVYVNEIGNLSPGDIENARSIVRTIVREQFSEPTPTYIFQKKDFVLHSGGRGTWKIECDNLTDEDLKTLALMVAERFTFGGVYGVPRGGVRFQDALIPHITSGPLLIVDDVLTTGTSMEEAREQFKGLSPIGVVIFARAKPPVWINSIFQFWEPRR